MIDLYCLTIFMHVTIDGFNYVHGSENRIYWLVYPISLDTDTISANDSQLLEISLLCRQYHRYIDFDQYILDLLAMKITCSREVVF